MPHIRENGLLSLLLLDLSVGGFFRIELARVIFVCDVNLRPDVLVPLGKLVLDLLFDKAWLLVHLPKNFDGLQHLFLSDSLSDPLNHQLPQEELGLFVHVVGVPRHSLDAQLENVAADAVSE